MDDQYFEKYSIKTKNRIDFSYYKDMLEIVLNQINDMIMCFAVILIAFIWCPEQPNRKFLVHDIIFKVQKSLIFSVK